MPAGQAPRKPAQGSPSPAPPASASPVTRASREQAAKYLSGAPNAIIVLNGPSASGKSTLFRGMCQEPGIGSLFGFSVSHTTRGPREGEREGVDYHYVARGEMEAMVERGEFLETSQIHGNLYGTSFKALASALAERHCVLDIDYKGSLSLKSLLPGGVRTLFIFVQPPSMEVLEQRLRGRNSETDAQIQTRLRTAQEEMEFFHANPGFYDVVVVNDDKERATKELTEKVRAFLGV